MRQGPKSSWPECSHQDSCIATTSSMSGFSSCYSSFEATCGNGLVEPGEECEGGGGCCDPVSCTLPAGAQCIPVIEYVVDGEPETYTNECCYSSGDGAAVACLAKPTTETCAGGGAYCARGVCQQPVGRRATNETSTTAPPAPKVRDTTLM